MIYVLLLFASVLRNGSQRQELWGGVPLVYIEPYVIYFKVCERCHYYTPSAV